MSGERCLFVGGEKAERYDWREREKEAYRRSVKEKSKRVYERGSFIMDQRG